MEVDVGGLIALVTFVRGSMDQMRTEIDALLSLNARVTEHILSLQVAVHHSHNNPIVINDNKEGEVVEVGSSSLEEMLAERGLLVEIIDDQESSPEV